jgi:signal transduction histidine kinase
VQETVEHARFPEGIGWQMICEPDPFMVYADPAQLGQVIGNLLVNAIEAMAGSGTITVQAQQEGSNQVIWFRDTGPGFSPQIVGDPREPLITTKITGTGLGLTICRDIVAQHGGTLTIEKNTEPGAVICVTLPKRVERILHDKQQRNTQK